MGTMTWASPLIADHMASNPSIRSELKLIPPDLSRAGRGGVPEAPTTWQEVGAAPGKAQRLPPRRGPGCCQERRGRGISVWQGPLGWSWPTEGSAASPCPPQLPVYTGPAFCISLSLPHPSCPPSCLCQLWLHVQSARPQLRRSKSGPRAPGMNQGQSDREGQWSGLGDAALFMPALPRPVLSGSPSHKAWSHWKGSGCCHYLGRERRGRKIRLSSGGSLLQLGQAWSSTGVSLRGVGA